MKLQLEKGTAQVGVKHGTTTLSSGAERRVTTVRVTTPDGAEITGVAICHEKDVFTKKAGKRYAFLNVLKQDNEQAQETLLKKPSRKSYIGSEAGSLMTDAQKHYKLSRKDRTTLFKAVCSEYVAWTPEQRAKREKALFNRLKAKYEPKVAEEATIKMVEPGTHVAKQSEFLLKK